jgi:hypothetical protein
MMQKITTLNTIIRLKKCYFHYDMQNIFFILFTFI